MFIWFGIFNVGVKRELFWEVGIIDIGFLFIYLFILFLNAFDFLLGWFFWIWFCVVLFVFCFRYLVNSVCFINKFFRVVCFWVRFFICFRSLFLVVVVFIECFILNDIFIFLLFIFLLMFFKDWWIIVNFFLKYFVNTRIKRIVDKFFNLYINYIYMYCILVLVFLFFWFLEMFLFLMFLLIWVWIFLIFLKVVIIFFLFYKI